MAGKELSPDLVADIKQLIRADEIWFWAGRLDEVKQKKEYS